MIVSNTLNRTIEVLRNGKYRSIITVDGNGYATCYSAATDGHTQIALFKKKNNEKHFDPTDGYVLINCKMSSEFLSIDLDELCTMYTTYIEVIDGDEKISFVNLS